MTNLHVVPDGQLWNVRQEEGPVLSTHSTQEEAERSGKEWLRANGGGEIFTHRDEGDFSRIRKGDAVR
jgi:hypothetical protein